MKNFQLRILMIQLVASCLLFLGIQQLYVLAEMDLIELIHSIGKDNFAYYVQKSDEFGISNQLKRLSTTKIILSIIGIVLAYVSCAMINFKRNYDYKMSLIVVLFCLLVYEFKFLDLPTKFFLNQGLEVAFIGTSVFAIMMSVLLFVYSYRTNKL